VRPAKAGQARVTGYGRTEPLAGENARERALQYDASEVLGGALDAKQAPGGAVYPVSDPHPDWVDMARTAQSSGASPWDEMIRKAVAGL
jgi:hypothetical protein